MSRSRRLVVVGASLAGMRAVAAARDAGHRGPITVVGAEDELPYDRPRLSKAFLDAGTDPVVPTYHGADSLDAEFRLGTRATGLDTASRTVVAGGETLRYDALVIATGADARRLPGFSHVDGVRSLRTVADARAIRGAFDSRARVAIVGAGFVGVEVASSARARGLDVTMVEALPAPMTRSLGATVGSLLSGLHAENGTVLHCGVTVARIEGDGRVERIVLSDGRVVAADLVLVATGAEPATGWLAGSGLTVRDGVVCDEHLAAGPPGVYAAGDVARWRNPLFGRHMRLEHWTNAAEQGEIAGRNAVGPHIAPCASVPYFWSDFYGHRVQFVGLPSEEDVEVVGDVAEYRFVVLYREGDRLAGALAVDSRGLVPRLRALVRNRAHWSAAVAAMAKPVLAAG
ncbi:MAG TPA: FAD-dependent oxidoreductase [Pseudonocardiaceae bacterium]